MMDEKQRETVLAQLHAKMLGEPFEQPSDAEVEEVAWWEACELDRVAAARDHALAGVRRLRAEIEHLKSLCVVGGHEMRRRLGGADEIGQAAIQRAETAEAEVRRLRAGLETIRDTFNSDTASVVNGTIRVHVYTHVERVLG